MIGRLKQCTMVLAALCILGMGTQHVAAGLPDVKENATSNYAKTRYPLVMPHGWLVWSRIGSESFNINYWYQILPDLARHGSRIFAAQLSPAHTTEFRGEQLIAQVEEVIAISGQNKVNLIGHSHGGPTVRYVAAVQS